MRPSNNLEKDSYRYILKSSVRMHESSDLQFFRTTTGIKSGPDPFDEFRFVMNFLTILGVMEILYSFRLVLEGKTSKFLENNFALSDAEVQKQV